MEWQREVFGRLLLKSRGLERKMQVQSVIVVVCHFVIFVSLHGWINSFMGLMNGLHGLALLTDQYFLMLIKVAMTESTSTATLPIRLLTQQCTTISGSANYFLYLISQIDYDVR